MMKLYWSPRSRSFSALWLMEETGQPYERVLTDISSGAQKTSETVTEGLTRLQPYVMVTGQPLFDSFLKLYEEQIGEMPCLSRLSFGVYRFDRADFLRTLRLERRDVWTCDE